MTPLRRLLIVPLLATFVVAGTGIVFMQAMGAEAPAKGGGKCPDGMKMTFVEISKSADGYLVKMRAQLGDSFKELEKSISKGKQSEIQAQNEAITNMKALVKLAEQDNIRLKEASAKKNKDEAAHQLVKICLASSKVNELFNQVKSAGGVVDVLMTEVERTMEHKPGLPVAQQLAQSFMETLGEEAGAPVPEDFVSTYD